MADYLIQFTEDPEMLIFGILTPRSLHARMLRRLHAHLTSLSAV